MTGPAGPAPRVEVLPAEELQLPLSHRASDFLRRVLDKAVEDNIFFMAGAISFNVLVAVIPLVLLTVGVSGIVLAGRFADPTNAVIAILLEVLPAIGGDIDLISTVEREVRSLVEGRRGLTVVGAALLVWFSTRLVGTLRTVLREVFDIAQDRGILRGKVFDAQVVLVGGALLLVNIGVTAAAAAAQAYGVDVLGLQGEAVTLLDRSVATLLAFLSIWVLFLGCYRYLPARFVPWRTAVAAATFTAVFHEVLKFGFGWYAIELADYGTTYGNLVTVAVLFLWIYYESVVFILGGEVAQVWTMRRARRVKTRSALFGSEWAFLREGARSGPARTEPDRMDPPPAEGDADA